tara:strand:- start:3532 stop:4152 length:621 start_codon:yes stop_codon:yes gene_type:complete
MNIALNSSYDSYFTLGYDAQSKPLNVRSSSLDNSQALGKFLATIEKRAFRRAQIATGNIDDALDIVQDAMLTLVNKYANKDADEWALLFHSILSSRIMDWHRRTAVRRRFGAWLSFANEDLDAPQFEDVQSHGPEQILQINQSIAMLEIALQALPIKQQQVFLLRAWEGLSEKETAKAMSCSVGAVKSHYSRARTFLSKELEEERS